MKWKIKDTPEKEPSQTFVQQQGTVSSVQSISFLANDNLTFQRFSDGVSVPSSGREFSDHLKSRTEPLATAAMRGHGNVNLAKSATTTTGPRELDAASDLEYRMGLHQPMPPPPPPLTKRQQKKAAKRAMLGEDEVDINFSTAVWTTSNMNKLLGNNEAANIEFQYLTPSTTTATTPTNNSTSSSADGNNTLRHLQRVQSQNNKNLMANNSTIKLLPDDDEDDKPCKQSKCSAFRSIIFCLCLNVTYANIFRFPREFHKHGVVFLIPYFTLLLVIGLPLVLFEVAIGQFLGQGSAHTWRAAPFFKGGNVVARIASWLLAVYNSMQAALAFLYVGYLIFEEVPFKLCSNAYHNNLKDTKSGQECLKLTFLTPVLTNASYYGLLALALVVLWIVAMVATHSGKILRRSIYCFGIIGLSLLLLETGWDIAKGIDKGHIPNILPAAYDRLADSSLWFSALVQVILSTQIGVGAIPVLTGKYLYKGDAVKTSFVYVLFNVVVCFVAGVFFLFQFDHPFKYTDSYYPELVTLTAIYDKAKVEDDHLLKRLVPGLMYLVAILSAMITVVINIYTTSRVFRRHRNYVLSMTGLLVSVLLMLAPNFLVARLLDVRFVGPFIVCACTVELIGLVWVYGVKNVYTDLEFSIGRPICKLWLGIWILTPLCLAGLVSWWMVTTTTGGGGEELLIDQVPRWVAVVISMGIVVIVACVVVARQVDYNFMAMMRGANKPTKNWGPADPLVRHAWKQWTSKCEDTGERDFTLRRRGTKDYTNSIKRGQYPHQRYGGTQTRNTSTQGSNSPNYSGSVFGDSAIEEDMSVERFQQGGGAGYGNKGGTLTRGAGGGGGGGTTMYSYNHEGKSPKFNAPTTVVASSHPQRMVVTGPVAEGGTLTRTGIKGQQQLVVDNNNVYSGYLRGDIDQMYESNTLGRRRIVVDGGGGNNFTSRIEIMPQDPVNYNNNVSSSGVVVRNGMGSTTRTENTFGGGGLNRPISTYQDNYNTFNIRGQGIGGGGGGGSSVSVSVIGNGGGGNNIINNNNKRDSLNHGWRKYSGNSEEFSTEL